MRSFKFDNIIAILIFSISGCFESDIYNQNTQNPGAPTDLSYTYMMDDHVIYEPISTNSPVVTGTVDTWSIEPALPEGLTINSSTGIISGTPTVLQPATDYTITGENQYGQTSVVISMAVILPKTINGYWKNGTWNTLPNPYGTDYHGWTNSLVVSGDDIYSAGKFYNSKGEEIPGYWKNWKWTPLTRPYGYKEKYKVFPLSIVISGSDIYVIGACVNSDGVKVAGYWLNETWVPLSNPYSTDKSAYAYSLAFSGGDIYIRGICFTSDDGTVAGYWLNGTWIPLENPYSSSLDASTFLLMISGGYVIVTGYCNNSPYNRVPGYWRNGIWTGLSGFTSTNWYVNIDDSAIIDGNVYISGYQFDVNRQIHGYWKNGTWVTPSSPYGSGTTGQVQNGVCIYSLGASGNSVYAGGSCTDSSSVAVPGYWVNWIWTPLSNPYGDNYDAYTDSILKSGDDVYAFGRCLKNNYSFYGYWKNNTWVERINPYGHFEQVITLSVACGDVVYSIGYCNTNDFEY